MAACLVDCSVDELSCDMAVAGIGRAEEEESSMSEGEARREMEGCESPRMTRLMDVGE